jgi:hypothetical protein
MLSRSSTGDRVSCDLGEGGGSCCRCDDGDDNDDDKAK